MINRLLCLVTGLLVSSAAMAHTSLVESEIKQGVASRLTMSVPHGCGSEATLRLRVRIPEGLVAVKPQPKAGWALEVVTGAYETPQKLGETILTEGVLELIWEGNLPDAYFDEFAFRGAVTEAVEVGSMLYIPAVQECATGVERWIEIPMEGHDGHDGHDLARPAPAVKIIPAGAHHH